MVYLFDIDSAVVSHEDIALAECMGQLGGPLSDLATPAIPEPGPVMVAGKPEVVTDLRIIPILQGDAFPIAEFEEVFAVLAGRLAGLGVHVIRVGKIIDRSTVFCGGCPEGAYEVGVDDSVQVTVFEIVHGVLLYGMLR
jgi:hypothetical protein